MDFLEEEHEADCQQHAFELVGVGCIGKKGCTVDVKKLGIFVQRKAKDLEFGDLCSGTFQSEPAGVKSTKTQTCTDFFDLFWII